MQVLAGGTKGSRNGPGTSAQFDEPYGINLDVWGNTFVGDDKNHKIRRITSSGEVSTIAGSQKGFRDGPGGVAQFDNPLGVAVDGRGQIFVADYCNHKIRYITLQGVVCTLAGSARGYRDGPRQEALFTCPTTVLLDARGNVFVGEGVSTKGRIRRISPQGVVTTLAGNGQKDMKDGMGLEASFGTIAAMAWDLAGNLLVVDSFLPSLRRVTMAGLVTTVAGSYDVDLKDGPLAQAKFVKPTGVVVDPQGTIYVSDLGRIRKVDSTGVYTVGEYGRFNHMAFNRDGCLLAADGERHRILKFPPGFLQNVPIAKAKSVGPEEPSVKPAQDSDAQHKLGLCYYYGDGVTKDLDEAVRLFRLSAAQGHAGAQSSLGAFYEYGIGVTKDLDEAARLFRLSAAQGNADAQHNLAVCYYKGYGVTQDLGEAARLFRLSVAQGNAEAQNSLGMRYHRGEGVTKDLNEALRLYRLSAAQNNAGAQYNLAVCYYYEEGVTKDLDEAVRLFRLSAAQGNDRAQNSLGLRYQQGEGVRKDLDEAARLFRLSAAQGHAGAQYNLGLCYYDGKGVTKDLDEAARLFRLSAAQGNADAQTMLNSCSHPAVKSSTAPPPLSSSSSSSPSPSGANFCEFCGEKLSGKKFCVGCGAPSASLVSTSKASADDPVKSPKSGVNNDGKVFPATPKQLPRSTPSATRWTCSACTYMNSFEVTACAMCETPQHLPLVNESGAYPASSDISTWPAPRGLEYLRETLQVGMFIDVRDAMGKWLEAEVIGFLETSPQVHYVGWDSKWDETVHEPQRIASRHRYTSKAACDYDKNDTVFIWMRKPVSKSGWTQGRVTRIDGQQLQVEHTVADKKYQYWYHALTDEVRHIQIESSTTTPVRPTNGYVEEKHFEAAEERPSKPEAPAKQQSSEDTPVTGSVAVSRTLPPPPKRPAPRVSSPSPRSTARITEEKDLEQGQQRTERVLRGQVAKLSTQLNEALETLTSLQRSAEEHKEDLEKAKIAIQQEPKALPALVQSVMISTEYEDMLLKTERKLQASLKSHALGLQNQLDAVVSHLSSVGAKTDAMYAAYAQQKVVLLEQDALLKSVVAPFYNTINAVLSSRLQAMLLLASGVLQGKRGAIVGMGEMAANGVKYAAEQAVVIAAEVSALAADAIPIVGSVVGVLLRTGAEKIDDYRSKRRQQRVAANAITTSDAEVLAELAARRCSHQFQALIEADISRFDDQLESAGRKAGQIMFDTIVGGSFNVLLEEAMTQDPTKVDKELTVHALCLAVQKQAMVRAGLLKKEGGIFFFRVIQADLDRIAHEARAGPSPGEKQRRAQAEELQRAQALEMERLRKTMAIAVEAPRKTLIDAASRNSVTSPLSGKLSSSQQEDVAIDVWLSTQGFSELIPGMQGLFDDLQSFRLAFHGLSPKEIRDELGLEGLSGLAVATKLRKALDKDSTNQQP